MDTQVDSYLLNFRKTEGHFVSFNILRHNYLMDLGDRVNWFAERIQRLEFSHSTGVCCSGQQKRKEFIAIYSSHISVNAVWVGRY